MSRSYKRHRPEKVGTAKTGFPISRKPEDSGPDRNIAGNSPLMSSTGISRALGIIVRTGASLVLAGGCALTHAAAPELSCPQGNDQLAALGQAPSGARQLGRHVLAVSFKGGTRKFVDQPPHEPLSGLHWRYCGYHAEAKIHLIGMTKDGLFSGKILFEETGALLRAGHTVLFSPGRRYFLAIEQEDGIDGEWWSVYDTAGKATWSGYAGTMKPVDGIDTVLSTFDQPRWNAQGELSARFVCADSDMKGLVTLRPSSGGRGWRGQGTCSP